MSQASPQRRRFQDHVVSYSAVDWFEALTSPVVLGDQSACVPDHRKRVFPPLETLSMFIAQALSADGSCQQVVNEAATDQLLAGLPCVSTATGGYCRARARLPVELIQQLTRDTAEQIDAPTPAGGRLTDRRVRVVDGTTLSLPDTPDNQAHFPQPRTQREGVGFPLCRFVAAFNLSDGTLANAALGGYRGKGAHEQSLLRELLDDFESGDIMLGDALFCTYFLLAELNARGVDGVFEQHGSRRRSTDFRRGHRLGARDHRIVLTKPKQKPDWMTDAAYAAAPDTLTVRELKSGGKLIVTTLTNSQRWPKRAIAQLYQQRWDVEINLRHIKTTLDMGALRCKTPDMIEKEVWVHLLAYNLIRRLMADSGHAAGVLPRQLSFQHTAQLWQSWRAKAPSIVDAQAIDGLLELIAQPRVGNRSGRVEPRAVKRRPKPYARLTMPRANARASIRRYGHPNRKAGQSLTYVDGVS